MVLPTELDGFEQAPEGAEQAEEHQQPDQIAAGSRASSRREPTESRSERIASVASDKAPVRSRSMVAMGASRAGRGGGEARIGDAEGVHPADLGVEPQHLLERVEDAGDQHDADQPVEPGIVQEALRSRCDWLADETDQANQEYEHAHRNTRRVRLDRLASDRRASDAVLAGRDQRI